MEGLIRIGGRELQRLNEATGTVDNTLQQVVERVPNVYDSSPISINSSTAVFAGLHSLTLQKRFIKVYRDPKYSAGAELDALAQLKMTSAVPRSEAFLMKARGGKFLAIAMDDAGVSLRLYIETRRQQAWSEMQLWTLVGRILETIASVHAENWIHGNISPDTVFILHKSVRLINWSNAVPAGHAPRTPRTATDFTAPESTAPGATGTPEADIFSTGKVIESLIDSREITRAIPDACRSAIRVHLVHPMTEISPKERPTTLSSLVSFVKTQISHSLPKLSLAEKALNHLVHQINMDPQQHMLKLEDERRSIVFASIFEKLHYLSALYVLDHGYTNEEVFDVDSLHEYYNRRERKYREMFAIDRDNQALEDPYLMLNDVFGTNLPYRKQPLTERESSYFYCFRDGLDNSPLETDLVVPTFKDFDINFLFITRGLFGYVDWTNVFVAGGSVLACLTPNATAEIFHGLESSTFFNSDIDVFFTGLTLAEVEPKITAFCKSIERAIRGKKYIVVRNLRSMTIVAEHPARQIQIIFRLFASPAEVLMGFDVDSCAFGFDGSKVWALPRALRALTRKYNLVDMTRRSASYEYRLMKYGKRGFAVATPDVDASRVKRVPIKGDGLAKLITLDSPGYLAKQFHREEMLRKHTKLEVMQLIAVDSAAEPLMQNENSKRYSHYQFLKIPYGKSWNLSRIFEYLKGFLYQVRMGAHYNSSIEDLPYREPYYPDRRREADSICVRGINSSDKLNWNSDEEGDNADNNDEEEEDDPIYVQYRIYPFEVQENGLDKVLKKKLDHFSLNGGKVDFLSSWVTVNPGKQLLMTGSFEPIVSTMEEWIEDAYEGVELGLFGRVEDFESEAEDS
ncbi:hypothetical protein BJ742DRAFT_891106 [Cladochytrium replicatum]|nr:hypothetical protein BJ742DRAFT_891106 [Cladochytrium replicatum]